MLTSISLALALLQAPAAVTLRYQPALNKPYRYASTTTMVQQMPGGKSITITQKAVTVMKATARSNGKTTLLTTNESATVTVPKDSPMAGMAKSMEDNLKKMKVQSTMDATGKVVDSKMTGASGAMQSVSQMNGMQTFGYPSSAVKVGSSWQVDFDAAEAIRKMAPQAKANGKMPIKMRVTGIRRQGGLTLVDLAVAMTGNMNFAGQGQSITSKITGNGSVSIDAATGMPVSQTMKQVMVTAFGKQSMTSTTTISMRKL